MKSTDPFYDVFSQKLEKVNNKLNLYLKDPNEENIHDIRTSIRRLESAYSIFPNSCKTKSSDKHVKKIKKFFSQNNRVRDFDIILAKLHSYEYDTESKLILTIQKKKLLLLKKAIVSGEKIPLKKKLKIKKTKNVNSKFEKRISSLIDEVKTSIPIVIKDESNVDKLHSLRKTIKKLRYVLELDPNNSYDNLITQLKRLQELLGEIHDCDIFIKYFEKQEDAIIDFSEVMTLEKRKRSAIYKNLVYALSGFKTKIQN